MRAPCSVFLAVVAAFLPSSPGVAQVPEAGPAPKPTSEQSVQMPPQYAARFGTGKQAAHAASNILHLPGSSKDDKLAALDTLTYLGPDSVAAFVGFHIRMSRDHTEKEWDRPRVEAMSRVLSDSLSIILRIIAMDSEDRAARVQALVGLRQYVRASAMEMSIELPSGKRNAVFSGDPDPAIRSKDSDLSLERRKWLRRDIEALLAAKDTPDDVRKAAEDVLAAIKDREEREKAFVEKIKANEGLLDQPSVGK